MLAWRSLGLGTCCRYSRTPAPPLHSAKAPHAPSIAWLEQTGPRSPRMPSEEARRSSRASGQILDGRTYWRFITFARLDPLHNLGEAPSPSAGRQLDRAWEAFVRDFAVYRRDGKPCYR